MFDLEANSIVWDPLPFHTAIALAMECHVTASLSEKRRKIMCTVHHMRHGV